MQRNERRGNDEKNGGFLCVLWLATVLLPALLLQNKTDEPVLETNLPSDGAQELPDGGVIDVVAELPRDAAVTVEVMVEGQKVALQLDAYLPGVLAAEMPASFPEEALKAQVVAARSFILYRMENPPADGVHDGVRCATTRGTARRTGTSARRRRPPRCSAQTARCI